MKNDIIGNIKEVNRIVNTILHVYKSVTLLPKDHSSVPDNGSKNLLKPNITCMIIRKIVLSLKFISKAFLPQLISYPEINNWLNFSVVLKRFKLMTKGD